MNITSAEARKTAGNKHFKEGAYEDAIKEYSTAIIQNPDVPSYYTNRAFAYLKLSKWDKCVSDCRKAIEIDKLWVKGYYILGQALAEQYQYKEAISVLRKAYSLAIEHKDSYTSDILTAIFSVRRKKWELDEKQRIERESELIQYLKGLINAERKRQLQSSDEFGHAEMLSDINDFYDERISQVELLAEQSNENLKKRVVPDYFCDKISFNILVDPVVTPSGITYERSSLHDHFIRIGYFDPLTRTSLNENDLISNLALKEAADDFIDKNGWAVDY